MGKSWDASGVAYKVAMWREVLRVLKPGGYLLSFSGSRTYHRMACAIEDAGFEIRDMIEWLYGSGFPKSLNVGEGRGTALKPAHEPICMARKPFSGTVLNNVQAYGTGALNIDACRVQHEEILRAGNGVIPCRNDERMPRVACGRENEASAERRYTEKGSTDFAKTPGPRGGDPAGRFPANLVHDGSDEVVGIFPESSSGAMSSKTMRAGQDHTTSVCFGVFGGSVVGRDIEKSSGSAARFFYCAKASRTDRDEGLEGFEGRKRDDSRTVGAPGGENPRNRGAASRSNFHPTVKPTELMRWLVRLVTPVGGVCLDPFCGSGSTGKAAMLEGLRFIGCDITPEYLPVQAARIEHAYSQYLEYLTKAPGPFLHEDCDCVNEAEEHAHEMRMRDKKRKEPHDN